MKSVGKILMLLASIAMSTAAFAADIKKVKQSKWNASYADNDGTFNVTNLVVFNGKSGYYVTEGGKKGKLTGLVYSYITPKPELKVRVDGTWSLGGESGGVTFRVSGDGKKFSGQWINFNNNKRGTWSGKWRPWKDEGAGDEDEEGPVAPGGGGYPGEDEGGEEEEGPVAPIDDDGEDGEEPAPVDPGFFDSIYD